MGLFEKPKEEKKSGFGLFKKKEEEKPSEFEPPNIQISVNALDARLKSLEGRSQDLGRRFQLMDNTALQEKKRFSKELKVADEELLELKKVVNEVKTKMDTILSELQTVAHKEDLATLQKYIDLWEPLKFATRKEVEKMIEEARE